VISVNEGSPAARSPRVLQRFLTRLRRWRRLGTSVPPEPLPVYGFELVSALLRGWQTHVARQRLIHEQSARYVQHLHYLLGGFAVLFAAVAGSSAVAAWERQSSNTGLAVASALIAAVASVLAGVVTFLDLGGRAERHRKAAADYKQALRKLEAAAPPEAARLDALLDHQISGFVEGMRTVLGDIDASAPIPPRRIAERIERRPVKLRSSVHFVGNDDDPKNVPSPESNNAQ
jgi:hypothetical protein